MRQFLIHRIQRGRNLANQSGYCSKFFSTLPSCIGSTFPKTQQSAPVESGTNECSWGAHGFTPAFPVLVAPHFVHPIASTAAICCEPGLVSLHNKINLLTSCSFNQKSVVRLKHLLACPQEKRQRVAKLRITTVRPPKKCRICGDRSDLGTMPTYMTALT